MPEIFAHFPSQSGQQPSPLIGGQIFAVSYPHTQRVDAVQEELPAVPTGVDTRLKAQILEELSVFHHATADILLRKLGYSPNSYRHVQKQIHALSADKLEDRFVEINPTPKRDESRFGSAPYVYTLGRRGYKYLRDKGKPVGLYRASDARVHKEFPLRHRLAVNEFLLKAFLLAEDEPNIRLRLFRHEQYWKGNSLKVRPPDAQKSVGLSPDLLLAFDTLEPPDSFWFLPEINLSEPWRKDWEAKVRLYRYCMPAYRERFGTSVLTTIPVMVASPAAFPRRIHTKLSPADEKERQKQLALEASNRNKRLLTLLHWTEGVLDRLNMRQEADLFSFSSAPLDELTPAQLFFEPHWIIPFSDTPRPLIPSGKEGNG